MIKQYSKSQTGQWTCFGQRFVSLRPWATTPMTTFGGGSHTWNVVSVLTDSVNTSGLWKKERKMVAFVPRKGKKPPTPPRRPIEPWYRPPVIRPQRLKQSRRSYEKALAKHKALLYVYDMRFKNRMESYKQRLTKYERRLKYFQQYQAKVKNGVMKNVRVRTTQRTDLPWHPYVKQTTVSFPATGYYTENNRMIVDWAGVDQSFAETYQGVIAGNGVDVNSARYPGCWSRAMANASLVNAKDAANSRAATTLHDKLSGQSVHIANVVAERMQTAGLIADLFKRVVNLLTNFSKKALMHRLTNLVKGRDWALKDASNDFLAFMFGVRPLLDDIASAAETLAHYQVDNLFDDVRVKARGSSEDTVSYEEVFYKGDPRNETIIRVTIRQVYEVRYVLQYSVNNVAATELQKLGLINPAEIAWESMPWSFVIDWILPVGTWLRSLTSETGLSFQRGTKSELVETHTTFEVLHVGQPAMPLIRNGSNIWLTGRWTQTYVTKRKERKLLTQAPSVPLPSFKSPVTITHSLEALALLIQKFR